MNLSAGTRLGPYEILSPLGAGGMGEVWKARDTRLNRIVAIKSSKTEFSERFEREAHAVAALNHPNICQLYDVGPNYLVMEFVEGAPVAPPDSARKLVDLAVQIADGLSAAHAAGVIHRDLKPDNILVTKDARVKILDFGLAKAASTVASHDDATRTANLTNPGSKVGTIAYMSPEQARGNVELTVQSDQFSFGLVLYELAAGKRAFERGSAAETMTAIIREDALPLPSTTPAPLRWIIERLLSKDPSDRYDSTRDLYRDLRQTRERLSEASATVVATGIPKRSRHLPMLAALVVAAVAGVLLWTRWPAASVVPTFTRLSFRRGAVWSARFSSDGQTIIYSAAWDGRPMQLFSTRLGSREATALGPPGADILAVSSSDEMALGLDRHFTGSYLQSSTLARQSLAGGSPREVVEDIQWADWSADGNTLAIVHDAAGANRLEFPIGTVIHQSAGWVANVRISPDGQHVAFLDHPARAGDQGEVIVADRNGRVEAHAGDWVSVQGLAWPPGGREVWFTGTHAGGARALYALSLSGKVRLMMRVPDRLRLEDVSRGGRVLLVRDYLRLGIMALAPGAKDPTDISWMDFSALRGLSHDGSQALFDESGDGGGQTGEIFLRKTDGSPPVDLGAGTCVALSPDGKWAFGGSSQTQSLEPQWVLVPTGLGSPRRLPLRGLTAQWASFLPDGNRILMAANQPSHGVRLYIVALDQASGQPISPEGVSLLPYVDNVSPDGKFVAARGPDSRFALYALDGSGSRPIPGLEPGQAPSSFSGDGASLYVYRPGELPAKIYKLNLATGSQQLSRELMPPDSAGVYFIRPPQFSRDGNSYAYSYARLLSDLFLVDGLK
jgi:WD40 repeat protein/predicted Ser/Thr protein kinase